MSGGELEVGSFPKTRAIRDRLKQLLSLRHEAGGAKIKRENQTENQTFDKAYR